MFVAKNRVVGTFDRAETARSCFAGLRRGQLFRPSSTIWVKPAGSEIEIAYSVDDARATLLRGLAVGGAVGFFGAALVGLIAVHLTEAQTALAWLAASVGLIAGALLGALFGPPVPHPAVVVVEGEEPAQLTVETTELDDREWAADLLSRGHARVVRRTQLDEHRGPISLRHA